jgi:hypothetical protein
MLSDAALPLIDDWLCFTSIRLSTILNFSRREPVEILLILPVCRGGNHRSDNVAFYKIMKGFYLWTEKQSITAVSS